MLTLSPADLEQLTDYKSREKQCAWLREHGIPFRLDGKRPIVCAAHVEAWVTGVELRPSAGPRMDMVT